MSADYELKLDCEIRGIHIWYIPGEGFNWATEHATGEGEFCTWYSAALDALNTSSDIDAYDVDDVALHAALVDFTQHDKED